MPWAESRIILAERSIEDLYRRLLDATDQLKLVRQQLRAMDQQIPGSGPSGGGGQYLACTLSAALAHGSSVTGQAVWALAGGSRSTLTTTAKVYNDGPSSTNDIASGKTCILMPNDDGSYTAVGVYC